jgi:uncharacterized protein
MQTNIHITGIQSVLTHASPQTARLPRFSGILTDFWERRAQDILFSEVDIPVANLHKTWNNLKILQLSDLHFTPNYDSERFRQKILKRIDTVKPDIIVFTGDLVHNGQKAFAIAREFLPQLKAPLGVYAVMGNHDYWDTIRRPWERLLDRQPERGMAVRKLLTECGLTVLNNETACIERDGQCLWLTGVDDTTFRKDNVQQAFSTRLAENGKAAHTFTKAPAEPHIALCHNPEGFDRIRAQKQLPDMTLSGHTHGGHYDIRWLEPLRNFVTQTFFHYNKGLYIQPATHTENRGKDARLYVTTGLARNTVYTPFEQNILGRFLFQELPPGRINTTCEIPVYTLKKA